MTGSWPKIQHSGKKSLNYIINITLGVYKYAVNKGIRLSESISELLHTFRQPYITFKSETLGTCLVLNSSTKYIHSKCQIKKKEQLNAYSYFVIP